MKPDILKRRRKALMAYHQVTLAQLARELGLAQRTVGTVVNRYPEKKSRRIQEYIAQRLGVSFEKLWGPHKSIITDKKRAVND